MCASLVSSFWIRQLQIQKFYKKYERRMMSFDPHLCWPFSTAVEGVMAALELQQLGHSDSR